MSQAPVLQPETATDLPLRRGDVLPAERYDPAAGESQERARRVDVDTLRIIASIFVITIHATFVFITVPERTSSFDFTYWLALVANQGTRCAVPIFLSIAGWTLLSRPQGADEGRWLRRRLWRLLPPLLFWNLAYLAEALVMAQLTGQQPWSVASSPGRWLIHEARLIVMGPGTRVHLWFMYAFVAMTVVFWLIRVAPRASGDRSLRTLVFLVAVTLISSLAVIPHVYWSTFGWTLGYGALGYVMFTAEPMRRLYAAGLYVGATVALVGVDVAIGYGSWLMTDPSPLVIAQAIGMIALMRSFQIPDGWRKVVLVLAPCTFGVYFFHMMVENAIRQIQVRSSIPSLVALLLTWVVMVVATYAAVFLWHKSRVLRRVMG